MAQQTIKYSHLFHRSLPICTFLLFYLPTFLYSYSFDTSCISKTVKNLDFDKFKSCIKELSAMGDRKVGSASNTKAQQWFKEKFQEFGYTVETQSSYTNIYCTKIGSVRPDSMYLISAHFDGIAGGGAANDDGSGCALVLECSRVLAPASIKTRYSIRFLLFNSEENGLLGSKAYAKERSPLQGKEDPVGSKQYPEPVWKGLIQHDMILFDHGLPVQSEQSKDADIDVEYKAGSKASEKSKALALAVEASAKSFSSYPVEVGSNMSNTDSEPFMDLTSAISVRENQRLSEIGNGSDPHWHKATDLFATFSEKDFLLGFQTTRTTLGAVCRLAGVYDGTTTSLIHSLPIHHLSHLHLTSTDKLVLFTLSGKTVAQISGQSLQSHVQQWIISETKLSSGIFIAKILSKEQNNRSFIIYNTRPQK